MAEFNITPPQTRAIAALMTSRTQGEAAKAAGVKLRSIQRWSREPEFLSALRSAESEAISQAVRRLSSLATEAAEALAAVMRDPETPASVRVGAARGILTALLPLREQVTLEERIAALEEVHNG